MVFIMSNPSYVKKIWWKFGVVPIGYYRNYIPHCFQGWFYRRQGMTSGLRLYDISMTPPDNSKQSCWSTKTKQYTSVGRESLRELREDITYFIITAMSRSADTIERIASFGPLFYVPAFGSLPKLTFLYLFGTSLLNPL
jgi:hypothetical protein